MLPFKPCAPLMLRSIAARASTAASIPFGALRSVSKDEDELPLLFRRLVGLGAAQQIIQSADAIPAVAIALDDQPVLAALVGAAVVLATRD